MIIVIGGTKGGGGKSTIAINLATIMAAQNMNIALVDGDEQKSSVSWSKTRGELGIPTPWSYCELFGRSIRDKVLQMKGGYDHIIVDVGGRDTQTQRAILTIADFYLVPIKPGILDLRELNKIKEILEVVLPTNLKLPAYAVLNQADTKSQANEFALKTLETSGFIKPLKTIVRHRVSIRNSLAEGLTIIEAKPRDHKAINEITSLYEEIYKIGINYVQTKSSENARISNHLCKSGGVD